MESRPGGIATTSLEARGITKFYGATVALARVDFRADAGRITSIEGDNGSGKSTLLAILAGLARPSRGSLAVDGRETPTSPRYRSAIGLVAHAPLLYPDLTGRENLRFFAEAYGLSDGDAAVSREALRFQLEGFWDRPVRTYSRGQLQRTSLARALVPNPPILLLDEPTTGLDAENTGVLVDAMQKARAAGRIVVLVTHDRALADGLADTRVRLERGRVKGAA
ncbi:MAG: heme ABC exporter ATP-binding protein CcmA [Polyangiales bacterium]|nr:heme ABC exporter ATP-binding protein CcmA [Myxococcales bacterium]